MGFYDRFSPAMVSEADALSGGSTPLLVDPSPHEVLGTPITGPWRETQRRILVGLGCFWGAEKLLWQQPGVVSTSVGYAGGFTPNPTYREVCTGRTGHAEVVEVVYEPGETSLRILLTVVLEAHDPTQGFRQGNDVGTQYRSVIYADNEEDVAVAHELVKAYGAKLAAAGYGPITTELMVLADTPSGDYFRAEDYHQQYLAKNPDGYCPVHSTGVSCG